MLIMFAQDDTTWFMADKQLLEKKEKNKKLEQYSQYCKSLVVNEDEHNNVAEK